MNAGKENYLERLTAQLAEGVERLGDELHARHAEFIGRLQNPDGGFSGREGDSDLYYTGFALRSLAVLDALELEVGERAAAFLRHSLSRPASVIDFFSLLYACVLVQAAGGPDVLAGSPADWPERVAATLETFRTPDHGYAKAAGAAAGSTYHTFLVGLCYQLLGRSLPRPAEVMRFIGSRRREDGGYVEIAPMRRSGTNPTAAAVGVVQLMGGYAVGEEAQKEGVLAFLAGMPSGEGGFRANGRAPLADLLSTFTGAWTLQQLDALGRIDTEAALRYVQALEISDGGFHGGLWDEGTDVEYTFYGLGALALLTS
jgi:geranylgeranyl transferase type-2 subunit beta